MKTRVNLDLDHKSDPEAAVLGNHIIVSMTGNANYPAANIKPPLATVQTAVNTLLTAIANKGHGKTSTDAVRVARQTLNTYLEQLANFVENTANDPAVALLNQAPMVHSAGMEVRAHTLPNQPGFVVVNDTISGTVVARANGVAGAHEWQYAVNTSAPTAGIPVAPAAPAAAAWVHQYYYTGKNQY